MSELKVGDAAPDFRSIAVGGKYEAGAEVGLSDLLGTPFVLYFYPKDDTPGCTAQACGLRDSWSQFRGRAEVFGVSVDSPASHAKFIAKFTLPFPLLADTSRELVQAYGVWVEKSMYGKKYMGAERTTFVVDAAGKIAAIFRKVKPEDHVALVRDALEKIAG